MTLAWIILFTFLGGVVSVAAAGLFLVLEEETRRKTVPLLVAYATGVLLGAAFLGLLPEAMAEIAPGRALAATLAGLFLFFVLEQFIVWRHCHTEDCAVHDASGPLVLIGDGVHNFVDGAVIAAAFMGSFPLGIAASAAVLAHELPQEVGDFAILLKNGYSRRKAFLMNILSGSTALPGGVLAYLSFRHLEEAMPYVTALAAAGFIYIALADLIPGSRGKMTTGSALLRLGLMVAGVGSIALMEVFH